MEHIALDPADAADAILRIAPDRAIAFDLGGVLLRGGVLEAGTEAAAFATLEARFGVPAGEAERIWVTSLAPSETGELPEADVWAAIAALAPGSGPADGRPDGSQPDTLADDIRTAVLDMAVPDDAAVAALARLKAAGVRTALASNHLASWIDEWRRRFPWFAALDAVVCSEAVGVRKPDPRFFRLLRSVMGDPNVDPWFVDDRGPSVEAARAGGFVGVWAAPDGRWHLPAARLDGMHGLPI